MIVVEVKLISALGRDRDEDLGTMVIDNVTTRDKLTANKGTRCDYRCRMYRKGALQRASNDAARLVASSTFTRCGEVKDHARHAEPVHNLVAKALKAMGYG